MGAKKIDNLNPDAKPLPQELAGLPKPFTIPVAVPFACQPNLITPGDADYDRKYKNFPSGLETTEVISNENGDKSLDEFFKTHCIALIDTGVDPNHDDLRLSNITLVSANGNELDFTDQYGHGTHIAGLMVAKRGKINSVVPGAPIISYKITSEKSGEARWTSVADALQRIIDHNESDNPCKVCVVNLSFNAVDNMNSDSQSQDHYLYKLIETLYEMNVPVVVSGGNNFKLFVDQWDRYEKYPDEFAQKPNVYGLAYPANFDTVIACGASCTNNYCHYNQEWLQMDEKELAPFTQRPFNNDGNKFFITVPAVETKSAGLNNQYTALTGSSMAAPYVTGTIYLLQYLNWKINKKNPDAEEFTVDKIKDALKNEKESDMIDNAAQSPYSKKFKGGVNSLFFYKHNYHHLHIKRQFQNFKQKSLVHG